MEIALPLCSKGEDSTGTETENHAHRVRRHGTIGINEEQHMHYKLQSIVRALIIIIDNYASEKIIEKVVQSVRINITSKLSAPINFESIKPNFEQDPFFGHRNVVSTTLSASIDFIITLESREQTAFPERHRDPNTVDKWIRHSISHMERAKSHSYTGPDIQGPSTGWLKLAEGEDVLPPATPLVLLATKTPRPFAKSTLGPSPQIEHKSWLERNV